MPPLQLTAVRTYLKVGVDTDLKVGVDREGQDCRDLQTSAS